MPDTFRMHSASARMELLDGQVLLVTVRGPVTVKFLLALRDDIVVRNISGVGAFVADYTGAVVAMDGEELDNVLYGEAGEGVPSLPAALVVPVDQWKLWLGHSRRVAMYGISRRLYLYLNPALAWARREVLLGLESGPGRLD